MASKIVGQGDLQFELIPDWPQLPSDIQLAEAVGVATDESDRVFIFNRGDPPVIVLDQDGRFLNAWGKLATEENASPRETFVRPHGIWMAGDQTLYLTDDLGHGVCQYTSEGQFVRNIGPTRQAAETGVVGFDYRKITCGGPPFNLPTNAIVAPNGHIYVSDGYGNARVHRFDQDGHGIASWGQPGTSEGQFQVPHGIGVGEDNRIYVADRENSRIQIFDADGELMITWTDVVRPCEVFVGIDQLVYVAELGARAGLFPWMDKDARAVGGRITIFDRDGRCISRWGGGEDPHAHDGFYAPHDVWVDSQGAVYVGEVSRTAASAAGLDPATLPTLRKFARR